MKSFFSTIFFQILFLSFCLANVSDRPTSEDCKLPVAQCKSGIVEIPATGGNSMAVVTPQDIDDGSFDDAGGPVTLEFADGETELTFPCPSDNASLVHFVVLMAIDQSGNESSCFAFVLITDPTPPVAICKDITVELDGNGAAGINNTAINDGSFDNCSNNLFSAQFVISFSCDDIGPNTVTLTARDGGNNASNCTGIVTVEDNVAPTANCEPTTVQLNAQGMAAITGDDITSQLSDACGIQSEALSHSSFDCDDLGSHTVTLTVTDVHGNSSTCLANVLITNQDDQVVSCMSATVLLDVNGEGTLAPEEVFDAVSDLCDDSHTLGVNLTDFTCSDLGENTVTLTATDALGNTGTCTAIITVEEDLNLVVVPCLWQTQEGGINCTGDVAYDFNFNGEGLIEITTEDCYESNFYSNSDSQGFISQELCGDGEIITYVYEDFGDVWAGIAMRETEDSGAKMIQLAINGSSLVQRRLRLSENGLAYQHLFQNQGHQWLRLSRTGNQFRAYLSNDGQQWNLVLATNIAMANCIQVGLFLSNSSPGSLGGALFNQVVVNGANSQALQTPAHIQATPISQKRSSTGFSLFPNPATDEVTLLIPQVLIGHTATIEVFNHVGQKVYHQKIKEIAAPTEQLNFYNLPRGTYFLKLNSNATTVTRKLVLSR